MEAIAKAYKDLAQKERELYAKFQDLELDVRLAVRSGDKKAVEAANKVMSDARSEWHTLYLATKRAAEKLAAAIGVDNATLRNHL